VSVRVTRDPAYRFTAGHYARLGLAGADGSIATRPLSIASATTDPHLEFVCTLVPDGEFSARLASCAPGDDAYVDRTSYGFLTVDGLAPGPDLWMLATGTGIAPFLSILREPRVWTSFERIVVVHSVRLASGSRRQPRSMRSLARHPPHREPPG
jgi:ferredoxin--NADP+ reductase